MGYADAAALVNALRAARIEDLDLCLELDLILDAMKPVAELREASRQMGRQTLRILSTLRDEPLIGEFARRATTTPRRAIMPWSLELPVRRCNGRRATPRWRIYTHPRPASSERRFGSYRSDSSRAS